MTHVDCLTLCDNYYLLMIHNLTLHTAWGRCTPPDNLYNLRTTCAMPVKHFPGAKKLVTNNLKLKYPPQVTSDHAEMVYVSRLSEFTDQDI